MNDKKIKSIQADNQPGKFHRNDSFTEFYFDVPDMTGTKKEMGFIGRKHEDLGFGVADILNKRINKERIK